MDNIDLSELAQAQRDRLAFLELRLRFLGDVGRQHLVSRFAIKTAAASRDLALYREIAPRNLRYDARHKSYVRADQFWPVFDFSADAVLHWLASGSGDSEPLPWRPLLTRDRTHLAGRLDLSQISVLTTAMHRGLAVDIAYRSLTSGRTTRQIVPFALADSGLRWHLRAFDRRTAEFRDFVLGRIDEARSVSGEVADHERPDRDIQWNRVAELELVPHPANVQHPDTVEAEYAMEGGRLKVQIRAAMAGYLLRRWNVDCTEDHSLRGGEYQLWLRNRQALYGVTNLVLAPGFGTTDLED